ncbi:MAG TPA: antibiotic biosynthesis monooxygenase [Candidatus Acidoferrum sp.]|nr:antibiotic biosynthesis monooxygenase [Candidatus Acidoferrum sp.]
MKKSIMPAFCLLLALAGIAQAQAPTTPANAADAMVSVVYLDVAPGSVPAAISAIHDYFAACAGVDGFVGDELYAENDRPGHLVWLEHWRNQAAMEAQPVALQQKLTAALQPLRLSDIDRRPYKAMDIAATRNGSAGVIVVAHVDAAPPTQMPAILQKLVTGSRNEPGNVRFDVLQHATRANHFTVIAAWRDMQALAAHRAAQHTKQFRDEFGPVSGSPLDERIMTAVPPVPAR